MSYVGVDGAINKGDPAGKIAFNEDAFRNFLSNSTTSEKDTAFGTSQMVFKNFESLVGCWYGKKASVSITKYRGELYRIINRFVASANATISKAVSAAHNMAAAAGQDLTSVPSDYLIEDNFFGRGGWTQPGMTGPSGEVGITNLSTFASTIEQFNATKNFFEENLTTFLSTISNTGFLDSSTEESMRGEVTNIKNTMSETFEDLIVALRAELKEARETLESTQKSNTAMFQ